MKKSVAMKWVKALRSGKYKQAANKLQSSGGYCCLGVLCDIAPKTVFRRMVIFDGESDTEILKGTRVPATGANPAASDVSQTDTQGHTRSGLCISGDHSWCANRSLEESNCRCSCHAATSRPDCEVGHGQHATCSLCSVGAKLHSTMDAEVWTQEFMRTWGHRMGELDHDLMRAWFANSIMCGWDIAHQRIAANDLRLREIAQDFVSYYNKNGAQRLGNGKAFAAYVDLKKLFDSQPPKVTDK